MLCFFAESFTSRDWIPTTENYPGYILAVIFMWHYTLATFWLWLLHATIYSGTFQLTKLHAEYIWTTIFVRLNIPQVLFDACVAIVWFVKPNVDHSFSLLCAFDPYLYTLDEDIFIVISEIPGSFHYRRNVCCLRLYVLMYIKYSEYITCQTKEIIWKV